MVKTGKLNGKEITLSSSLFTIISYRQLFGTELFSDVNKLDENFEKNPNDVGNFIDILFRIIYVLHKPYTTKTYDQFLQELDFSVLNNTQELTELANLIGELLGSVKQDRKDKSSPR